MPIRPQPDPFAAAMKAEGTGDGALPEIDGAVLDRLIDMIGPATTPEFVIRLLSDLRRADAGIGLAHEAQDAEGLRRHSHILIGLAGTVGATRLLPLAQGLNRMADTGSGVGTVVDAVRAQVAGLIAAVMARNPAASRP